MVESGNCPCIQLINSDGEFNVTDLEKFVEKTKLSDCGYSYVVVAIMGPQSSGKSTLLNKLFHTKFREMNAFNGRNQTTRGIWMAKSAGIEPFTVVMDLEGSDGKERGEEDTFEKQSALFAVAVADIVMINMWCHDIGREQAANRPLLKTVFQVMLRILSSPRKRTLLFVIRDKTKTPLEFLARDLREDIQRIWDSTPSKPEELRNTPLSTIFNVEVVALSNYEYKEELFNKEVAELTKRFFHSMSPGGLAGDRRDVVHASAFCKISQKIWDDIKENKDLNIPAHRILVANFRCDKIAEEKRRLLENDVEWLELQEAVKHGLVPGFGKTLGSILRKYFSEYDAEAMDFDEEIRKDKGGQLKTTVLSLVYPAYETMLEHLRSNALESFKTLLKQTLNQGEGFANAVRTSQQFCLPAFDKGCEDAAVEQANWDASKVREQLILDFNSHSQQKANQKKSKTSLAKLLGIGGTLVTTGSTVAATAATVASAAAVFAHGGLTTGAVGVICVKVAAVVAVGGGAGVVMGSATLAMCYTYVIFAGIRRLARRP